MRVYENNLNKVCLLLFHPLIQCTKIHVQWYINRVHLYSVDICVFRLGILGIWIYYILISCRRLVNLSRRVQHFKTCMIDNRPTLLYHLHMVNRWEKLTPLWCFCLYLRYGAGTQPWGNPTSTNAFEPQRHDDGYIEVIGLSTASLVSKHNY